MKVEIPAQRKIICRYSEDAQAMVHMEECAELIQAVSKMRRVRNAGKDDGEAFDNLVEEMADVLMYFGDVMLCYGITEEELRQAYTQKFERNMNRW